jgi:hypothetical protein
MVSVLHSELVAVKRRLAEIERNIPTPEQLGAAVEALRLTEKLCISGGKKGD